jgi:hypothetical protein
MLILCAAWLLLQVKLAEQTDIAQEASQRAEQLEEDLAGLRAQVAQVRHPLVLPCFVFKKPLPCHLAGLRAQAQVRHPLALP